MPTLTDTQLRALARLGAVARLKELEDEAAAIRKEFPGLRKAVTPALDTPATAAPKAKKQKRNLSPEARQAARERMQAYWAKKRGEKAAGASPEVAVETKKTTTKRAARKAKGRKKA